MEYYKIQQKTKTETILYEIIELYGMKDRDGNYTKSAQVMLDNWEEYAKAFECYYEEDIIRVIRQYWKYHSDKQRPRLKQILALLVDLQKKDNYEYQAEKPVCVIKEWQKDFDYVMQKACCENIIFNPYWSNKDEIKANRKGIYRYKIDGDISTITYALWWKKCLQKARKENISEFEAISRHKDIMLEYTLAYRLGYLN